MALDKAAPIGSAFDTGHYAVEAEELEALDREVKSHRERRVADPTMIPREVLLRVSSTINEGRFEPPRPPELALRMMHKAEDPNSCSADLAELAHNDAFLAGRLLQLANSVQFGPRNRKILSLPEAITRLGLDRVRNVVLAAAMWQNVYTGPRQELMTELWRRSIGAAVGCRLISQIAEWDDDRAFFTGLVHDMGKPVLAWTLDEVIEENYPGMVSFEKLAPAIFHMLHARVGAMIVRGWGLSPRLAMLLLHHHDREPPQALERPVLMLRMANLLYESWCVEDEQLAASPSTRTHPRLAALMGSQARVARLLERYPAAIKAQLQS